MPKAIIRQELEKIPGVTRTWIEIEFEDDMRLNTLVVEVDFPTDGTFREPDKFTLNRIAQVSKDTLATKTTMTISKLRVVPSYRE
jgi:hypothetical protein